MKQKISRRKMLGALAVSGGMIGLSVSCSTSEHAPTKLAAKKTDGTPMQFFPKNLEVSVGDTVRWINKLEYHDRRAKVSVYAKHNTMFKSHLMVYGEFYEYVFEEKGVFYYGAVPYESFFKTGSITVG